jgi:hypothetical protein
MKMLKILLLLEVRKGRNSVTLVSWVKIQKKTDLEKVRVPILIHILFVLQHLWIMY